MEIEDLADEPDAKEINPTEFYSSLKRITLKDVTFSYGRDTVLESSNLTINKGDFVCIKGISGIGKSTLFKLLLGVYPDYQGEIGYETENGVIKPNKALRKLYSFVPQGNLLFSGSLRENLTFVSPNATDQDIEKALKLACAYDFVKDLPNGVDTVIGEKGLGLSEGQTQRIAIARALLVNAPILLLDEATSALDESSELKLLENLRTLDGVTLIIISHKKAAESFCNRTLEVVNKRITEV
jgi:ATP-binding cassette subfamily B protein